MASAVAVSAVVPIRSVRPARTPAIHRTAHARHGNAQASRQRTVQASQRTVQAARHRTVQAARHRTVQAARLTPRGRMVLTLVCAAAVLVLSWLAAIVSVSASTSSSMVTVQPGDTLWSIAVAADPGADPRVVIHEIRTMNGLSGSVVTPGQVLRVP